MSEKNKTKSSKKWLISRLKTSGSKRSRVWSPDYADTRNTHKDTAENDLPFHESMSKSTEFYNGKINSDLLKRFLNTQVGKDWDDVYAEILERIPTKLWQYKDCIYWYVADKVEVRGNELWDLSNQKFIEIDTDQVYQFKSGYSTVDFYVDPQSNKLVKIGDFKSSKKTKEMTKEELQKFRAYEEKAEKAHKALKQNQIAQAVEKLKEHN